MRLNINFTLNGTAGLYRDMETNLVIKLVREPQGSDSIETLLSRTPNRVRILYFTGAVNFNKKTFFVKTFTRRYSLSRETWAGSHEMTRSWRTPG